MKASGRLQQWWGRGRTLCVRQRAMMARTVVGMAILVLVISGTCVAGSAPAYARMSPGHAAGAPLRSRVKPPPRPDLQAEAAWFALSHYGRQYPAPDARLKAFQQAAQMPRIANAGPWTPLGPQPVNSNPGSGYSWGLVSGRITALSVDPSNSNDVWASAADGGGWHSTDGGQHWTPMTDTQNTLSIGAIALDPTNPSTIYVGTGEANLNNDGYSGIGVLKSTNGGQTWSVYHGPGNAFEELGIAKIAIDPANSQTLLLAASYVSPTLTPR